MKLAILILSVGLGIAAQEDQDNSFTGTLVENTSNHLKVSRVLQGKAEERVFKVNAQTKIEGGRLRLRQRVYVRYVSSGDEGDIAILVIIRAATTPDKKK